jgi:hypothetical protein
MAKNTVSSFVGLKSRRERRLEARENKTEFVSQYNGDAVPYHMNSKAVGKILKNDRIRNQKLAQRGVLN